MVVAFKSLRSNISCYVSGRLFRTSGSVSEKQILQK